MSGAENKKNENLAATARQRIEEANEAVQKLAGKIENDKLRPAYHFRAPGGWMNDIHGIFHDGEKYHMFYQHNPYKDYWDTLHWGHTTSRDLLHWEHQPVAFGPIEENNEAHCYSGCSVVKKDGTPKIFYTSIPFGSKENSDAMYHSDQRIATPLDDNYITWDNYSHNIFMMSHKHQDKTIYDWRDPFIFEHDGDQYMILAGNFNKREGGEAHLFTYKAADDELEKWDYSGILYTHPNPHIQSMECPNLMKLNDEDWVLFHSPYSIPEFVIGNLSKDENDELKFTENVGGIMDYSTDIYAPTGFHTKDGRALAIGWIRGFPENRHWSGCASIPRELSFEDGVFYQKPFREMKELRGKKFDSFEGHVKSEVVDCIELGNCIEILCTLKNDDAKLYGLTLETEHSQEMAISIDHRRFKINNSALHQKNSVDKDHKIQIFVDKSVVEVFVDDRFVFTYIAHNTTETMMLKAYSRGGSFDVSCEAWEINPVWDD